ncbi:MAG: LysM peptidoglycan-binding domain-containing protein [Thermodesulfobacteriota bacterium]
MVDKNGFDPRIDNSSSFNEDFNESDITKGGSTMKNILKRADFPFFLLGGFILILLIFILVKLPAQTETDKSEFNSEQAETLKKSLDELRNEIAEIQFSLNNLNQPESESFAESMDRLDKRFSDQFENLENKLDEIRTIAKNNQSTLEEKQYSDKKPVSSPEKKVSAKKEETSKEEETSKKVYHEVKKGDTLYSISRKYDVAVSEIKNLNNIKNDAIQPGAKLLVKK